VEDQHDRRQPLAIAVDDEESEYRVKTKCSTRPGLSVGFLVQEETVAATGRRTRQIADRRILDSCNLS